MRERSVFVALDVELEDGRGEGDEGEEVVKEDHPDGRGAGSKAGLDAKCQAGVTLVVTAGTDSGIRSDVSDAVVQDSDPMQMNTVRHTK